MYLSIYILYICFSTKKKQTSLLFIRVNTFYSTITITTVYIPNQKAFIVYREDDGHKRSVNYDQVVCNMLSVTAILYVCVCESACGCVNTYPTAPPSDTNAHTPRANDLFCR